MSADDDQSNVSSPRRSQHWRLPRWLRSLKMLLGVQFLIAMAVFVFVLPGMQDRALEHRKTMVYGLSQLARKVFEREIDFRTGRARESRDYSWRVDCLTVFPYHNVSVNSFTATIPPTGTPRQACLDEPAWDFSSPRTPSSVDSNSTAFVGVFGEHTLFGRDVTSSFPDSPSQTGLLLELVDSNVPWWEPRDITLDEAIRRIRNCPFPDGLGVGMANGTVRIVPPTTPVAELRKLFNCNDGDPKIRWSLH